MQQPQQRATPAHCEAGLAAIRANGRFIGKSLEEQHRILEETLQRALADERLSDIAASFDIPLSTLNYNLIKFAGDDWRDTQAARALTRLQDAGDKLESAKDVLEVARSRERLKSAQWELEKLLRRLYGDKLEVSHSGSVTVNVVNYADAVQQSVIEGEARKIE